MDDPSSSTPTKKKGRRGTRLKDLTRNRSGGHKKSIQFDELTGVAIGPNRKRFRSFVAVLGRSKGSILKERWKDVAGDIKDKIWDTIIETFDVPNTKLLKKKWLAYAGQRWRGFKTYLTSYYIFGELSDKSPCEKYTFLDEETWQTFVKSRKELSFQEKRNKAKVLQSKNVYPHRLSRGGYELLDEKMIQEKEQQRREASQLDPSSLVDPPSPPARHEKWKRMICAMSGCQILKGSRKKPTWHFPDSPMQDGTTECGFYVMRHMLNIVTASITGSWMERFHTTEPFPREDLYDIQKRWARLFLDLYPSRIVE